MFGSVVAALGLGLASSALADNTTVSYDSLRTGWDSTETNLSPASVGSADFGQLFNTQVDGQVFAQPISAKGVLFVATENNSVYGLDPANGAIKWSKNLGRFWPTVPNCPDLVPNVGITSTPVYDGVGTVYLTSKVNDGPDIHNPHWYMHALDIVTGAERADFPVIIQGNPDNDPLNTFTPEKALQRPGLLLLDGVVYAGFGAHCDRTPYVGYVLGINASTGKRTALWSTEAGMSSAEGGIWQSGGGLVSDGSGRILLATGNGIAPAPGPGSAPPTTLGESVVRLGVNANGTLSAQSFFSPHDNLKLNIDDADLGSGGPMALPNTFGTASHPHLLVQVGKDGRVYLLDRDNLGGSGQGPGGGDLVVSMAGPFLGVWGHPAFWGGDGGYVYTVENQGPLRALQYGLQAGNPTLTSMGTSTETFGYGSGSPVVTSSGTTSGSALVWVVSRTDLNPGAQLRAYDAVPRNGVMNLRYSAPIGVASKFTVAATDGGRVFVGTSDPNPGSAGHVLGFGRPTTSPLTAAPYDFGSVAVGSKANGTVSVTATADVTVTGISTQAPFTVTPPTLPTSLLKNQVLSVPVSFTPSTWGTAIAALTFKTSAGDVGLDLRGNGTQPGLGASPSQLAFDQVRTGAAKQLGVNIVNTGTTPEKITGTTSPAAPFNATNLPAAGTTLAAGASIVIPVTYTPTNGSSTGISDSGALTVTADAGSVTVPLSGTALTGQPQLTVAPRGLDFNTVPVGQSVPKTFDVSNTGTVPLTITKAKAPTGVFSTSTPVAEGQVLAPGAVLHITVTFTPTDTLGATAMYELTGNDGQGAIVVQLAGNTHPIQDYYESLGGSLSYLGDPIGPGYQTAGGGMAEDFRGGSIYWSPTTGAHAANGAILYHYKALGGPGGSLGYPTTDEMGTPDGIGRYNHFNAGNGGSIYWTAQTGAQAIYGAIRDQWAALGWETSALGYPTSDEFDIPGGRRNNFVRGAIEWYAANGATSVIYY